MFIYQAPWLFWKKKKWKFYSQPEIEISQIIIVIMEIVGNALFNFVLNQSQECFLAWFANAFYNHKYLATVGQYNSGEKALV